MAYEDNVFINCPFDIEFDPIFFAMVFAVFDCGFVARCSKEETNSANIRIDQIAKIIQQSQYGIHDISRTELDEANSLPRFNMPLELGMFLGAKKYGNKQQKSKTCLILDHTKYRYNKFISDINGQDIKIHENNVNSAIKIVTDWLRNSAPANRRATITGGTEVARRYKLFQKELPDVCTLLRMTVDDLGFNDYAGIVSSWIKSNSTIVP